MPEFKCKNCGEIINFSREDQNFINSLRGNCINCHIIIASGNYPKNIIYGKSKSTTIFSPMGRSLGDRIISQAVIDRYISDNPDENVIFLENNENYVEIIEAQHPTKIFLCDIGNIHWDSRAFWFSLTNEALELARQGWYSRLPRDIQIEVGKNDFISKNLFETSNIAQLEKWVIMHLRNIKKQQEKNIKPHYVYSIIALLKEFYNQNKIAGIIFVGNDEASNGLRLKDFQLVIGESIPIIDFRNILSLSEIAWLCSQAGLFIGRDSGIAHLAAAAKCPKLIVWGYESERWFPIISPKQKIIARKKQENDLDMILKDIIDLYTKEK